MKREDQEGLTLQVSSQDIAGNPEEDHINLGQNNAFIWGSKPGCQSNVSSDMLPMFDPTQCIKGN
jgi:hypothetical protein